jgi:hypothetical protein
MKAPVVVRRGLFAVTSLAVLLTGRPALSAVPDAAAQPAFQEFDQWLGRYLAARASTDAASAMSIAGDEGLALAKERRSALLRLARTDPRQVLEKALRPSVLKSLPLAIQEESEEYVDACGGDFGVFIGDDFGQGDVPVSRVTRTLTIGERTFEAQVFGRRIGTPSKPIHANGIAIDNVIVLFESPVRRMEAAEAAEDPTVRAQCGVPGPACIAVKVGAQTLVFPSEAALRKHETALEKEEGILGLLRPAGREEALRPLVDNEQAAGRPSLSSPWTTGEKTLLYIRVDMSDRPGDPVPAATVQDTMDVAVNNYYKDSSYSKTSIPHATVIPTVRLPRTAAEYDTIGDGQLMTDAVAAARAAGFDVANYNLYIVAFPRLSYGYSGKASVGRARVWLNGSFGSGVTSHELGHNYGVHHANLWKTTDGSIIGAGANLEYGNVFDVMGRGGVRGIFNAWFKTRFDWLLPAEYTTVAGSGTFRIGPIDDPAESGQRALKIVKDTNKNYWVEFRRAFTSNRWAMNGAMLNWGYNQNTGSHLLDTTPNSVDNQNDAPLLVGRTFSDILAGIHITPVARSTTPATMDVVVKLGAFPGNSPPAASLSASATTVPRNTPVTLTVSASDVNNDALAYGWEFDDGTIAPNAASVTKSWSTSGSKLVRCIVSDMVGGTTITTVTITVGTATTFTISGTVRLNGQGLAGVTVSDGTRSATTGSTGAYTIAGVPNGTYTVTPTRGGYTFSPSTLSVTVSGANRTGRDFTASLVDIDPLLTARFDTGTDGFAYQDDAFRGTAQPSFASGGHLPTGGVSGGALGISLGGINDDDVANMSGGWRVSFTLPNPGPVRVTFAYNLTQNPDYESDERSQVLAALDGAMLGTGGVVAEIVGNGNGGTILTTGFRTFQAESAALPAGLHTLVIGGFNSQKTLANESTGVRIDDVQVSRGTTSTVASR